MQTPLPLTRDLVLIGGGHTHALVLRMWAMNPLPGVRVTLVNPGPTAVYSGMLPGFVAGHYGVNELEIDLLRLSRAGGARFVDGNVNGIDRETKAIRVSGHRDIRYDVASIDIGITSQMPDLKGFSDFGCPAKPLGQFALSWDAYCNRLKSGQIAPDVCVIGAGLAGVELALSVHHRLTSLGTGANVALIDENAALPGVGKKTRETLRTKLLERGVQLLENTKVSSVAETEVQLADGRTLPSSFTLGAAGAQAQEWLSQCGLQTADGFLVVDSSLRSVSDPRIFATGDCAHLSFAPRPKAGVFAVRQAPVLNANLRAELAGLPSRRFRPQKDYLKLISTGGKEAVADRRPLSLSGAAMWAWKDRIDRKFMRKFQDLKPMPQPKVPRQAAQGVAEVVGDTPLCGGCGAKVAGSNLRLALSDLPAPLREDVLSLPGDDAAVLSVGGARQVMTTDHLRAFTDDPVTMARISAVHALGDVWAMGAQPQSALASLTLPRMSGAMQTATLREILDTAADVFRAAGADIVGGHTSVGAELTIGFTVTGLLQGEPITLAGAKPGDALILTKPIGSGTLLAGEMQLKAKGHDVLAALASMGKPQGDAARILSNAHAMTDVTGFGLAGHLLGICEASGVAADLTLEDIPVYAGAEDLAAAGVRSTIWPANREVSGRMVLPDGPRADLLFDPQTAGGLLAAVETSGAEVQLAELRTAGFEAAVIGKIVDGRPFITVI